MKMKPWSIQFAALLALMTAFALPASAQCLTGPGSTGFESGSQTYSVTPANGATNSQIEGITCEPNNGENEWQAGTGAGLAAFDSDYQGYSLHTTASSGGNSTGASYANAGGSVRWVMRVDSQPGYSGPTTIDIDLTALVNVNGAIQLSGASSGGGSYSSEYSIRAADSAFGSILIVGNGALAGAVVGPVTTTTSIAIDEDYVIQIVHNQSVLASADSDSMSGLIGSAVSTGNAHLSFAVGINDAFEDPLLEVYFPIQDLPGGSVPELGSGPAVPLLSIGGLALLCVALASCTILAIRKTKHLES